MGRKFYIYDETAGTWTGEVVINIPYLQFTSAEMLQALRLAHNNQSTGASVRMDSARFEALVSVIHATEFVAPYPIAYVRSDNTRAITANGSGANELIATVRGLASLGDIRYAGYTRLCVSNNDYTQNYIRFYNGTNNNIGLQLYNANLYNITTTYSAVGAGFTVFYFPSTDTYANTVLGCIAFTTDGLAYTNLYGAGLTGNINYYSQTDSGQRLRAIYELAEEIDIPTPGTDPYEPGGVSGPGGGDGSFDFSSTPVDFVGAPTIGAYDTGMVNLYVPSAADLRSLSAYLWAGAFDLDNFKKLVADPMDAIIGLSILPLTAAQIGTSASTLAVGNISTGISMPRATSQYVTVDCGSVQILPKWGAYLDFAPYSKLQLYLPYIGIVDISPDDCMNGTIAVRYTVDILSGTCYAQVKCNDHVLYNFGATCSTTCPVTSGQYQNVAFAALGAIGGIAGAVVSGMAGNVGGVTGGIENAANSVLSSFKPDISRSGGAGGSAGLMGHQLPYLILTVPRMCTPGYQNEFIGYPAYSTQTLGDLSGYTEIDSIHPAGIPCSEDELAEIVELLNGGVFL